MNFGKRSGVVQFNYVQIVGSEPSNLVGATRGAYGRTIILPRGVKQTTGDDVGAYQQGAAPHPFGERAQEIGRAEQCCGSSVADGGAHGPRKRFAHHSVGEDGVGIHRETILCARIVDGVGVVLGGCASDLTCRSAISLHVRLRPECVDIHGDAAIWILFEPASAASSHILVEIDPALRIEEVRTFLEADKHFIAAIRVIHLL
jgi:hypothetical protein